MGGRFKLKRRAQLPRPALDKGKLIEGFQDAAASEKLFSAILHMMEGAAVILSSEAGLPNIPPDEAKAASRAASEIRNLYSGLEQIKLAVERGDLKGVESELEKIKEG